MNLGEMAACEFAADARKHCISQTASGLVVCD
jgi:hypothetical protein